MKWFAGADHAGVELKDQLVAHLKELGDDVEDLGTHGPDSVDYPDFGHRVAERVAASEGCFGLLVCGTGIGISIAANRNPGIRAAVVTNSFAAEATRAHNDANVICLGSRVTGYGVAVRALDTFRATVFEGGRHQRRVDKLGVHEA